MTDRPAITTYHRDLANAFREGIVSMLRTPAEGRPIRSPFGGRSAKKPTPLTPTSPSIQRPSDTCTPRFSARAQEARWHKTRRAPHQNATKRTSATALLTLGPRAHARGLLVQPPPTDSRGGHYARQHPRLFKHVAKSLISDIFPLTPHHPSPIMRHPEGDIPGHWPVQQGAPSPRPLSPSGHYAKNAVEPRHTTGRARLDQSHRRPTK